MSQSTKEIYYCIEQVCAGSALEPAEYCEEEVDEEDALCQRHGGDAKEEADERAYQAWKDGDL